MIGLRALAEGVGVATHNTEIVSGLLSIHYSRHMEIVSGLLSIHYNLFIR